MAISAFLLGLLPTIALGHAELDTVTPADKSTVTGPPAEIVMTFTEPLKPATSSIKLADAGGAVVAQGSTVDPANPKGMRLSLSSDLAPGTYTVRWTTASSLDGDIDRGTTTFTVVAATPSPTIAVTTVPTASSEPSSTPSRSPSIAPSVGPSPSAAGGTPATSTSDALIPVIVVLLLVAGLSVRLLRGRRRRAA